jgi:hypothetical protein
MKATKIAGKRIFIMLASSNQEKRRNKIESARIAANYSICLMSDEYMAMLDTHSIPVLGLGHIAEFIHNR